MRASRTSAIGAMTVAMLALVACVPLPGQSGPTEPQETTAAPTTDPTSDPGTEATPEPSDGPLEPTYEYVTGEGGTSVWSFEPTYAEVVEGDYDGTPADPGHKLVILYISGQLLDGTGNFYWDFRVGSVNEETDQFIGLSSGTDFYANNDLFTAGQLPNFIDGAAIYQVPEDWPLGLWRFTFHETGEIWEIEVPVDGA